ncbi:DUF2490 domain-containing protein [Ferruginibacter lapsinanis]|uniref:DUF2490 domain-containing protein n=1 Tax=Ferruginibacter lapsinanis TaxID=563172 RepID=UPI001E367F44|nr:DUF2490 domain-containing protein [Ferruginibacter lapsinanis]UEG48701.1 DUF2490 domain-containing protein [Ferruginibacter lapsinanis]
MRHYLKIYSTLFFIGVSFGVFGQQSQKQVNHQTQAWLSVNSTVKVVKKWGFMFDLHERRNNFLKDNSFHFVRVGINYWLKDNIILTAGYGHMWVAPTKEGWKTFSNENRIYQQVQMSSKISKISVLQRLRNEQRWQEKIVNDKASGENKFTDRIRYLLSFTIPVFKQPHYPSLVIADELCMQFGKEVVYNTFDQNRVFVGIKQKITKDLSFDAGYMLLFQEKSTGYQYDHNDTFRWFFYYTPDYRKKSKSKK